MPRPKPILASLCLVAAALGAGCGGDDEPKPSIPVENAQTLASTLQEVQDNVDVGSCLVAQGKAQEFQQELGGLPSDVSGQVVEALERGSQNLLGLIEENCERPEETTTQEETTTEETTTDEETTTEETTQATEPTTPTVPTTPTTPDGSGGIGPSEGGDE